MAESRGGDDQPRHDLVANTEIKCGVEGVVAERNSGGHRDDIAGKERQLHARLALGDAVAHCRNTARDLGGSSSGACSGLYRIRKRLERLMGRKHVIVGSDNADIGAAFAGQAVFVRSHRGIGVGLIAAAQMRARNAGIGGARHAVEVAPPCAIAPVYNPFGNPGESSVYSHLWSPIRPSFKEHVDC